MTNLSPYEQLAALHQHGSVDDYINQFEIIASMIPWENEAPYLGYFMNGLQTEIKNWVRLLAPKTRPSTFTTTSNAKVALEQNIEGGGTLRPRVEGKLRDGGHVTGTPLLKNTGNWRPSQIGATNNLNPSSQPLQNRDTLPTPQLSSQFHSFQIQRVPTYH